MRPLEDHETLVLPENEMHRCSVCDVFASGFEDLDRVFGFRRMGSGNGIVRIQSRCHACRKLTSDEAEQVRSERTSFHASRGTKPGVVYIVATEARDLVKIGFTAAHPVDRLKSFQTANPDKLELLGFWPSDYYGERSTHAELYDRHVRGEWFELTHEQAIELLADQPDSYLWDWEDEQPLRLEREHG